VTAHKRTISGRFKRGSLRPRRTATSSLRRLAFDTGVRAGMILAGNRGHGSSATSSNNAPEAPKEWAQSRLRWERFNHVRTLLEVVGWACLSMRALADERR
jgi:hypothetical protein